MNLPKFFKAGPVRYWLAAAGTEFINGAIKGTKTGLVLGGGAGVGTSALEATKEHPILTPAHKALVAVGVFAAMMVVNGWHAVVDYRDKVPFPNPFPAPPDSTNPVL